MEDEECFERSMSEQLKNPFDLLLEQFRGIVREGYRLQSKPQPEQGDLNLSLEGTEGK